MIRSKHFTGHFLVILYFVLLSVFWTWPLVLHMRTEIPSVPGDNLQFIWQAGWFKQALLVEHTSPLFAPQLNFPEGYSLAYSEPSLVMSALALPGTLLYGEVFGYNLATMVAFMIAGLGMYYWVAHLLGGEIGRVNLPGLIAGTIFACLPFWFMHYLAGHLNILGTMWLPFYFWGLFDLLLGKSTLQSAGITGIALSLLANSSSYILYITLLATIVAVLSIIIYSKGKILADRKFWNSVTILGLCSLPMLILAVYPSIELASQGNLPARSIERLQDSWAKVEDFYLPSTAHFLWGKWIGDHFNRSRWIEGTLYVGFIAAILASVGVYRNIRSRETKTEMYLLLVIGIFFLVLVLGPELQFFNQPIPYQPIQKIQDWMDSHQVLIPLPGNLFVKYLPFFSTMRSYKRFSIAIFLVITVLAGYGSAFILGKLKKRVQPWVTLVILVAVLFDFYPGTDRVFTKIYPRQVDLWLATQPGQHAVVQLPFHVSINQEFTYYSLYNQKPYISAFFNAFQSPQYKKIYPILDMFPSEESIDLLQELGVRYAVINPDDYTDFHSVENRMHSLGITMLFEADGTRIYLIPKE